MVLEPPGQNMQWERLRPGNPHSTEAENTHCSLCISMGLKTDVLVGVKEGCAGPEDLH